MTTTKYRVQWLILSLKLNLIFEIVEQNLNNIIRKIKVCKTNDKKILGKMLLLEFLW